MSELAILFTAEATSVDPAWQAYEKIAAVDLIGKMAAADRYAMVAMPWLANAQRALQRAGAQVDRYYKPVGDRFNVVVNHATFLEARGHLSGLQVTLWGQFKRELGAGVAEATDTGKKIGLGILLFILVAIAVNAYAGSR